jgi:FkbM family methyltransferase
MTPQISYAQRFEDFRLLRCFAAHPGGFYIDVGAGHPVYDNVSFAFYLRGWSGITIEPNPWLAELTAAVRPRDHRIRSLVGATPGETTYYLIEHFHGLSTTIESNARVAQQAFGRNAQAIPMQVATLSDLCGAYAPPAIDFLKIDVEGAEHEVLAGNDWRRFRPKIVSAEALAPVTMAPAWDGWEPILTGNGYRFAYFDGLNRYYVADEHAGLAKKLAVEPPSWAEVLQFRTFKPALEDASHPDHRLAQLLAGMDPVRLPLAAPDILVERLTAGIAKADLAAPADAAAIAAVYDRLFGGKPAPQWEAELELSRDATTWDLYHSAVTSDVFRAACGRISASYAW